MNGTTNSNQQTKNGNNTGGIGWISDEDGIPCISGTRKSNAATYLPTIFGLSAAGAAGEALSQGQYTTQNNVNGLSSAPAGVGYDPAAVRTGGADWLGRWTGTARPKTLLRRARIWLSLPPGTGDDLAVGGAAVGGIPGTAVEFASIVDSVANHGNGGVGCGCHSGQL